MRFSLSNLLLMMVPLAVALTAVGYLRNNAWCSRGGMIVAIIAITFALPAMVGALSGGSRGMGKSMLEVLITFVKLIVLVVLVVAGIMLMAAATQHFGGR
jgi:hypothetical protein